ncbi:MAG: NADH-quinone oxidoreductase subunit L [Deltaproteobacteria bacterium]|nr:MAG: NADH-quinone oxidoreductase subunit L [Deltaproteobacteria bacterium]
MDYTVASIAPIVLLPFLAFVIGSFTAKKFPKFTGIMVCVAIFGSFLLSARIFSDFVFNKFSADYYIHKTFLWFDLGPAFKLNLGIYIDQMSAMLLVMVSGVGFLIHLFATYYMGEDKRYASYMIYMSLFTAGMLGVALSDNLLGFFMFWEVMGFCSYSLIGFYFEREAPGDASLKAFMTTRIGDVFFLFGLLIVWNVTTQVNGQGSFAFVDLYNVIAAGGFDGQMLLGIPLATFAGLCFFMGTIGKSAQFPLQVWLPDAMQGPTPTSALIHAATMVAAGVYLSLRVYPLLEIGHLLTFVTYIGAITAFGAATMALVQTDIKAVLAYSTISQLGFMVLGVGVGNYNAAFMHLITHAVFKACLFLSSGSVIHSLHDHHTHGHVQEMPRMGGLAKKMPYTCFAMVVCSLAISGVPFFSGFVSKDRILGDALIHGLENPMVYGLPMFLGFLAALLTAFYMFRMIFLTFYGEPRDKELYDHCHTETFSFNRNLPLLILTVFTLGFWYSGSLTGQGLVKFPGVENKEWFQTLIEKPDDKHLAKFETYTSQTWGKVDIKPEVTFPKSHYDPTHGLSEADAHHAHTIHVSGAIGSIFIAFLGIFLAYLMYIRKSLNPGWWVSTFSGWYQTLKNKYYFDHFYIDILIKKVLFKFQDFVAWVDMGIWDRIFIDGWAKVNDTFSYWTRKFDDIVIDTIAVDGTGASVRFFNLVLRTFQSGKIQFYFVVIFVVLASYLLTLKVV